MDTLTANDIRVLKTQLRQEVDFSFGRQWDLLPRAEFLRSAWDAIGSFIQHRRDNALVRDTVKKNPTFIAWGYTLLSIQYGAYSHSPAIPGILKDLIELFDKDLIEEEMKICDYASKSRFPYYPGLIETWRMIEEVYRGQHFDLSVLPPTPHLAYAIFTLNNTDAIGKEMSLEEMFGKLAVLDSKMKGVFDLVHDSQKAKT